MTTNKAEFSSSVDGVFRRSVVTTEGRRRFRVEYSLNGVPQPSTLFRTRKKALQSAVEWMLPKWEWEDSPSLYRN